MSELNSESAARLQKLVEFRFHIRKFLSFSEMAADAAGISAQQYQLMQVVAAMPEGRPASITHLAERMFLRHNSAVELVDRAVRAGLVQRATDAEDLRRSLVTLTPEGGRLLDRLIVAHLHELDENGHGMVTALENLLNSNNGHATEKDEE